MIEYEEMIELKKKYSKRKKGDSGDVLKSLINSASENSTVKDCVDINFGIIIVKFQQYFSMQIKITYTMKKGQAPGDDKSYS